MTSKIALVSLNVSYSPAQDRVLLSASTGDEQRIHLWLTQRLLRLIRPHVETWLTNNGIDPVESNENKPNKSTAPGKSPSQAVPKKQPKPHQELLVTHIDVGTQGKKIQLTFRGAEHQQNQYFVQLQAGQLNAWWNGIVQTCGLGKWSIEDPAPEALTAQETGVTLH